VKILVTVKRVPDPEAKIKIDGEGKGIITQGLKFVINPFDEIAVEEALKIKEKFKGEVVVASIGQKTSTEQIRTAMAMGADRGILVVTDALLDSDAVSKVLVKIIEAEKPDIVVMGKQAVDDDSNQVGQMLAERLGMAQATFASKLEIAEDGKSANSGLTHRGTHLFRAS
jgi:electron transfer flavoprotein beta subunit